MSRNSWHSSFFSIIWHPSLLPSLLPSFLASFLPSLLLSLLLCFLPSFIPSFLPSFLASFLLCFLPFFLPSFLPSLLPSFLAVSLLSSLLTLFLLTLFLHPYHSSLISSHLLSVSIPPFYQKGGLGLAAMQYYIAKLRMRMKRNFVSSLFFLFLFLPIF